MHPGITGSSSLGDPGTVPLIQVMVPLLATLFMFILKMGTRHTALPYYQMDLWTLGLQEVGGKWQVKRLDLLEYNITGLEDGTNYEIQIAVIREGPKGEGDRGPIYFQCEDPGVM